MAGRTQRCPGCGERFYSDGKAKLCQNCDDSYDPSEQVKKDAEVVRKANTTKKTKPQSYDPRKGYDAASKSSGK